MPQTAAKLDWPEMARTGCFLWRMDRKLGAERLHSDQDLVRLVENHLAPEFEGITSGVSLVPRHLKEKLAANEAGSPSHCQLVDSAAASLA